MWRCTVLVVLTVILLLTGCRNNVVSSDDEMLAFPDSMQVNWTVLENEEIVPLPFGISVTDSCLYVLGTLEGKWLHRYSKTDGQYLGGTIDEGQGPGDLLNAANLQIANNSLHIYDLATKSLKSFEKSFKYYNLFTSQKYSPILDIWELSDTTVLIKSALMEDAQLPTRSYKVITNDKTERLISSYDSLPDYAKAKPEIFMVQSEAIISPDRNNFASATTIGGAIEIFKITNGVLSPTKSEYLFPLEFEKDEMRIGDATMFGFTSLTASNQYLFGAYSGSKNPNDATKIGIWDWSGRPICLTQTDALILKMSYDTTAKTMYGVILDEKQELRLAKCKIAID